MTEEDLVRALDESLEALEALEGMGEKEKARDYALSIPTGVQADLQAGKRPEDFALAVKHVDEKVQEMWNAVGDALEAEDPDALKKADADLRGRSRRRG